MVRKRRGDYPCPPIRLRARREEMPKMGNEFLLCDWCRDCWGILWEMLRGRDNDDKERGYVGTLEMGDCLVSELYFRLSVLSVKMARLTAGLNCFRDSKLPIDNGLRYFSCGCRG